MDFKTPDLKDLNLDVLKTLKKVSEPSDNKSKKGKGGIGAKDIINADTINAVMSMLPKKVKSIIGLVLFMVLVGVVSTCYFVFIWATIFVSVGTFFIALGALVVLMLLYRLIKKTKKK